MSSVLITGATGFVGSNLVRACLARGDRVTALARPGSATSRLDGVLSDITLARADPAAVDEVRAVLRKVRPEVIFHLGATTRYRADPALGDLSDSVTDNLAPLLALLSAAAEVPPRAFVRAGTIAEYGNVALPYEESMREAPRTAYGASQLAGTHYLTMAQPRLPFAAVTARLALIYGPGQNRDFLIPQLIAACTEGRPMTLRRPMDRRDLIHIDDAIAGLLRLSDMPAAAAPVVNLATGTAETMATVAEMVVRATGADPALVHMPQQTAPPEELVCDASRAAAILGWRARLSLAEGLTRTLRHATARPAPTPAATGISPTRTSHHARPL